MVFSLPNHPYIGLPPWLWKPPVKSRLNPNFDGEIPASTASEGQPFAAFASPAPVAARAPPRRGARLAWHRSESPSKMVSNPGTRSPKWMFPKVLKCGVPQVIIMSKISFPFLYTWMGSNGTPIRDPVGSTISEKKKWLVKSSECLRCLHSPMLVLDQRCLGRCCFHDWTSWNRK